MIPASHLRFHLPIVASTTNTTVSYIFRAQTNTETADTQEKYTLDSLNEIKANEQFQWTRPEDGRNVWASKTQYFLAITSYSIGLGNVIRFPILVQKNGGLAFIIPFVIMLIVEGKLTAQHPPVVVVIADVLVEWCGSGGNSRHVNRMMEEGRLGD